VPACLCVALAFHWRLELNIGNLCILSTRRRQATLQRVCTCACDCMPAIGECMLTYSIHRAINSSSRSAPKDKSNPRKYLIELMQASSTLLTSGVKRPCASMRSKASGIRRRLRPHLVPRMTTPTKAPSYLHVALKLSKDFVYIETPHTADHLFPQEKPRLGGTSKRFSCSALLLIFAICASKMRGLE